jgi:hypothetical protein
MLSSGVGGWAGGVTLTDRPAGAGGVSTIIRDRSEHVTEQEWATFVSDAEDAVSHERTLASQARSSGPSRSFSPRCRCAGCEHDIGFSTDLSEAPG